MFIKRFALICLALIALGALLYESLFQKSAELYLSYAAKKGGYEITYAECKRTKEGFLLLEPKVVFPKDKGSFRAEELRINYSIHPIDRLIELDLFLKEPEVDLKKGGVNLEKLASRLGKPASWIEISGHFKNEGGILHLIDGDQTKTLHFEFDQTFGKSLSAHNRISSEEGFLEFILHENKGSLTSQHFDANILSSLSEALFPSFDDWSIPKGTLEGRLLFDFEKWHGEGALVAENISILHKKSHILAEVEGIQLSGDPNSLSPLVLEFLNGTLTFADNELYGMMRGLKGELHLTKDRNLILKSDGIWSASDENSYAKLLAEFDLNALESAQVNLKLMHLNPGKSFSEINLNGKNLWIESPSIDLEFHNVRQREFAFAERVFENVLPGFLPVSDLSGTLNASIHLAFENNTLSRVALRNIEAKEWFLLIKPWELELGADNTVGDFSVNLSAPSPRDSINASLAIDGGRFSLTAAHLDLWDFTDIHTNLRVVDGIVQTSSASVELAGLKGNAEIFGNRSDEMIHLTLHGKAGDLLPFVPKRIQNGIEKKLKNEDLILEAHIDRISHGIAVNGKLHISNETEALPIRFGFIIDRISPLLSHAHLEAQEQFLKSTTLTPLGELTPLSAFSHLQIQQQYLRQEVGYSGFKIRKGFFKTDQLALEKFVSPFIFQNQEMALSGIAEVEGLFDLYSLKLKYGASNVQLENEDLQIEVPLIGNNSAFHIFDFASKKNYGSLPVALGTYFDKNTGLLFTDIQAEIILEGEKVHIPQIETYSNGLYFSGAIDLDYSSPEKGAFDVFVQSNTMEGSFKDAQHFFSHFDKPFYFTEIPLDGQIGFGEKGARLTFNIRKDDYDLKTLLECVLVDGKVDFPKGDLSLQDLGLKLLYDDEKNTLTFSEIQGILLLGKGEQIDEYMLQGEQVHFSDFENNIGSFDFTIKDGTHELIRVVGKIEPKADLDSDMIAFNFNHETHAGEIYPKKLEIVLKDWNRVEFFSLQTNFRLSALLRDIHKLSGLELFFFSREFAKDLHQMKTMGGEISLELGFEGASGKLNFDATGHDLLLDEHPVKEFHLSGYKREDRWLIELLQLDKISLSSEIVKEGDLWKVDFLGLRYGKSILMGLSGAYTRGDTTIKANVNLLEVDLEELHEIEEAQDLFTNLLPKGKLKGSGEVLFTKGLDRDFQIDALFDTSLKGVGVQDFSLKDQEHVSVHYLSDRGFSVRNFESSIAMRGGDEKLVFDLKQLSYDFAKEQIDVDSFGFEVLAKDLKKLSHTLRNLMPDAIDAKTASLLENLKTQDSLKGSINFHMTPSDHELSIKLANGHYHLFDSEKDLEEVSLDLSEGELKISALLKLSEKPIWASLKVNRDDPSRGILLLADAAPDNLTNPALTILWEDQKENGLVIHQAKGYLAGLLFDMKDNPKNGTDTLAHRLSGSIDIDGSLAKPLLPKSIKEVFETLQIGNGYRLQGELEISKEKENALRFFGALSAKDFELKGYLFNDLNAQMVIEPTSFQLFEMTLSDPAGTLYIGNLKSSLRKNDQWDLSIPLLSVYEMRPSLLKEIGKPLPRTGKPLVVRNFTLQDVWGIPGNEASFRGQGVMTFINPQKKNSQNILFSVPSEILTRIGLNLSVLTPVSGTIYYELQQGKFVLTKFKDVYSDGKISKFHLPSNSYSTVDFDGNMNVQVRFKQSTLLLKLAEMFTITVQGNLKNPKYSLQRQKYFIKQEEVFASPEEEELASP